MATFQELGVREDLLRAITELGYENPMPIQEKVIPHLLNEDTDVVGLAQTGTGKTAAFGLPTLQRIDPEIHEPQALILDPTRELCLQTCSDLTAYAKYMPDVKVLPVYGGSNIETQIKALKKGVQVVVATPGRLIDLINRNVITLKYVRTVVLDEADEMLNMGFVDDINEILAYVPGERKMLLFSATMPREIAQIAKNYMNNPQEYVVGTRNESSANVHHIYYMVNAKQKYLALKRIVDYLPRIYGIIFCRTRATAQEVASQLIQDGYDADALHGDLSQAQRDAVMKKFRERNLQLLVATDVAARGLDVDDLTHIISYSLPDDNDIYNHRSGRTGRAGKYGVSIAIIHSREKSKLKQIQKHIGKEFERREVPTPQMIIEKQLFSMASSIENVEVNEEAIAKYLPPILNKLSWLSSEELVKRFLSYEFNRLFDYYKNSPEVENVSEHKERAARGKKGEAQQRPADQDKDRRVGEEGYERVYVNVGKADGFFAPSLIRLINENTHGQRIGLGRIDLMSNYSLFDVRKGEAHRVVSALKNADFYGKRLYLEIADQHKDYATMSSSGKHARNSRARRKQQYVDEYAFDRKRGGKRTRRDSERGFRSAKARRAADKKGRS